MTVLSAVPSQESQQPLPVGYAATWRAADAGHARSAEARIKRLDRPAKLRLLDGELPLDLGPLEPVAPPV